MNLSIDTDGYVHKYVQRYVYPWVRMHTSTSWLCQLIGHTSSDAPVEMSTLSAQGLLSNTILQQKEPVILGETADSRVWSGTLSLECLVVLENNKVMVLVKGAQEQTERAPRGQS